MLFVSAGIFYLTKASVTETIKADGTPVVQQVPLTFSPIQTYTENCLLSVGKRGLIILGQQGGYISPEVLGTYSTTKPTDSVGLNLQPTKIPYWHYNKPKNQVKKITFSSFKPKLYFKDDSAMSIESQLNRYIKKNLDVCLENYTIFDSQGFDITYGPKKITTRVGSSSVNLQLSMEVKSKQGESTNKMNLFYTTVPLNLKYIYGVAGLITETEVNYSFLEKQGLNLISVFAGLDPKKLPPTSATSFELYPTLSWNERNVQKNVRRILNSYIPMIRFLGSNNFYDYIYPDSNLRNLYQATYDQMVINLRGAEKLDVNFNYFNWPVYLKTNSQDGVIKPFHFFAKYNILTVGQQTYATNYDLSFPVLVTLRDPSAFKGEGYDFVFALEGNIRNNLAAVGGSTESKYVPKAARLACNKNHWNTGILKTVVVDSFTKEPIEKVKIGFTIPEQDECEIGLTNRQGTIESNYPAVYGGVMNFIKKDYLINYYPIDTYPYRNNRSALIGYPVKGLGADLPTKVIELHRQHPINISIQKRDLGKCITPLKCKTVSGIIAAVPFKKITCEKDKAQCFFNQGSSLFLDKKKELIASLEANGSVSRYHDYYFTNAISNLGSDDSAIATFRRVADLNSAVTSSDFTASVNLKGLQKQEIKLVPGVYEVSANLYSNKKLNISAEDRCMAFDILTWEKETCFQINGSLLKKQAQGMINWNTPKTYLKITPEDLYAAQDLTMYVLNQGLDKIPIKINTSKEKCKVQIISAIPVGVGCSTTQIQSNGRVIEDLQMMGQMEKISRKPDIRRVLEPRFS